MELSGNSGVSWCGMIAKLECVLSWLSGRGVEQLEF